MHKAYFGKKVVNDFLRRGFNASLSGLDASIGNLASDPSAKNILGTARDS